MNIYQSPDITESGGAAGNINNAWFTGACRRLFAQDVCQLFGDGKLNRTRKRISVQIQDVINAVYKKRKLSEINNRSKGMYTKRMICRVNAQEPGGEDQVKTSTTGKIKVTGLSCQTAKHSDTKLA